MGKKGTRKSGPKPNEERDARRQLVLTMLTNLRCIQDIYREVCKTFDVTSQTVRRDMRWACDHIDEDLKAAAKGDPVKTYHHLDTIAEIAGIAGSAMPLLHNGQPLMGRDSETGEEFPVLVADAKLLGTAIKARQAQSALMGYRDSIKWKRSLQHQQVELSRTKTELAKAQLEQAQQELEIDRKRKALMAAKKSAGGHVFLQKPDQELLDKMSRFLLTGKTELEGWILSHSQPEAREVEDAVDDGEDDVLDRGPERDGVGADRVPDDGAGGRGTGDGDDGGRGAGDGPGDSAGRPDGS